jgi:hypothetical protein
VRFSENFNDGSGYSERWYTSSVLSAFKLPVTVINNKLNFNSKYGTIYSNISSFSNENQILAVQFKMFYENPHSFCGACVSLLSNDRPYLNYHFFYDDRRVFQSLEVYPSKAAKTNFSSNYHIETISLPVKHKFIIYPNDSYSLTINNHFVQVGLLQEVENINKSKNLSPTNVYWNNNINKIAISFVDHSRYGSSIDDIVIDTISMNNTEVSV